MASDLSSVRSSRLICSARRADSRARVGVVGVVLMGREYDGLRPQGSNRASRETKKPGETPGQKVFQGK